MTLPSRIRCPLAFLLFAAAATPLPTAPAPASAAQPVAFTVLGADFMGDGRSAVSLGVGAFNSVGQNGDDTAPELRLEYRFGETWRSVGAMVGVMATTQGTAFGYFASYSDIRIAERWYVTPSAGVGAYGAGEGKDLGGVFQFHLGFDVAYLFGNGHRLGAKFTHISNAFIHDDNPGAESLLLTYTVPF